MPGYRLQPLASASCGTTKLVSGRECDVIVVLQDGRQLDGIMHTFGASSVSAMFVVYEVDGLYPQ